jgi:putative membrane-bound dehydrogenase-like protein
MKPFHGFAACGMALWLLLFHPSILQAAPPLKLGVARIDVTPDYPVRLSGFGFRREESEGVTQRIWAKALAIDDPANGPAVVITVDNLGIPATMTQEVARRLQAATAFNPPRLAITASHTHTAPMLTPVAPTLFGVPIPTGHQLRIDRYTRELTDHLEHVALAALRDLQPGRLEWTTGQVGFAKNRRTAGGPVDHDLPLMVVRGENDTVRALWFSYACHCVTLSNNRISGDWAGSAQLELERRYPGAVVLASIGCGADQNPDSGVTGDRVEVADSQGKQIADEVDRLLGAPLNPLTGPLAIRLKGIALQFDAPRERAEWEDRAKGNDAIGHHARVNLARLDRGETLPDRIDYPIQTWLFGDALAMIFLPGEVVVDYSLRLKQEFDAARLWINAYANAAPCYIPSERILREGGYEGGGAMIYYDQPTRFAPGLDQRIMDTIHGQVPREFITPRGTDGSKPLSPEASLRSLTVQPGMEIELVASEPLVIDPVAIDWGPDGRLWVVEMNDYPLGMQGGYEPGGRIRILTDTDGDGRYDRSTVFLDGLAFPTGVTVWGRGALISTAPDLLYAEDTDGDGRADKRQTLFTGFATVNYQARLNSISLGLDNWWYGANGLIGGDIHAVGFGGGTDAAKRTVPIRNHDFRFDPRTGAFETVTGLTQQGRVRDDWGNWFGCDNGSLVYHFPTDQQQLRRNSFFIPPPERNFTWREQDPNRLFPISTPLARFNDPDHLNRVTSACGLGIYRDDFLGPGYSGNAFTCEPVHNLVRRTVLTREGNTFTGQRAETERGTEFLAGTDPWFRPVQVRTGPDGALWIVDMYRFLMEHPIWIRPARLTELDPRAGDRMGRIYRVHPAGRRPNLFRGFADAKPATDGNTPPEKQDQISTREWITAISSANGTRRDLAHQYLLENRDPSAVAELVRLALNHENAAVRVQCLSVLDGLKALTPPMLERTLLDNHPEVRRHGARLTGQFVGTTPGLARALIKMLEDPDAGVRSRAAGALHDAEGREIAEALGRYLLNHARDPFATAAAWSSALPHLDGIADVLLSAETGSHQAADTVLPVLIRIAAGAGRETVTTRIAIHLSHADRNDPQRRIRLLADLAEALDIGAMARWLDPDHPTALPAPARQGIKRILADARQAAGQSSAQPGNRVTALRLLGRDREADSSDLELLLGMLDEPLGPDLQLGVFNALGRFDTDRIADHLFARWDRATPGIRRAMIALLVQRPAWTRTLLAHAANHPGLWREIPSTRRNALLRHTDESIRQLANQLQNNATPDGRADAIAAFLPAARLTGNIERGRALFSQRCAPCHLLEGVGRSVGPDLLELTDKSPDALMISILDPNRAVLDQYTVYELETNDARSLAGMIAEESAAALTLKNATGDTDVIGRDRIASVRATGLSLMPEGLGDGMSHQALADLVTFVAEARPEGEPPPRDPGVIAAYLLDDTVSIEERDAAVKVHYMLAPELLREMVRTMPVGTTEEYRRIPWIWRVAIHAGRGNDTDRIRHLLDLSLPQPGEPLREWQAVVVGGGLINGLSQINVWPNERLREIARETPSLAARFTDALSQSVGMADDPRVPAGTRYDALRMVALGDPDAALEQLERYLAPGVDAELQMGAVSGLADLPHPRSLALLQTALGHLESGNRRLAQDAVKRLRGAPTR